MTAQELADDMSAQMKAEFGDQYGFPTKYFNPNVTVSQPDGTTVQRSPRYCTTDFGAQSMQSVLAGTTPPIAGTITQNWPLGYQLGGNFADSQQVPWLAWGDGTMTNAALMLEHFTHGYPADQALAAAVAEIS